MKPLRRGLNSNIADDCCFLAQDATIEEVITVEASADGLTAGTVDIPVTADVATGSVLAAAARSVITN